MKSFEFTYRNHLAFDRWQQLDLTGRRSGFGQEFMNETSIDANLNRYGDNNPDIYERVLDIEKRMFVYRKDKQEQKQTSDQRARRNKSQKPSPSQSVPGPAPVYQHKKAS